MSTSDRVPIPPYLARPEAVVFLGVLLVAFLCLPSVPDLVDGLITSGDLKFARALLASAPEPRTDFDRARRLRQRCEMALLEGDMKGGIQYCREAVEAWPTGLGHRVRLADLEEGNCAPDRCRDVLEATRLQYHKWLTAGRPELLAVARDIVQLAPAELPTHDTLAERIDEWFFAQLRRLGSLERLQNRPDQALSVAREICKLRPEMREPWLVLASLEGQAGNREASREALFTAAKLGGGTAELHELLSYRLEWSGHADGAIEELNASKLGVEKTRERALMLLLRVHQPLPALAEYQRRYPSDRDLVAQCLVMARLLEDVGDHKAALNVAARGLEKFPRSRDLLLLSADLSSAAGDAKRAWAAARVLAELDPESFDQQARAADAAEAAHETKEAERLVTRLEEIASRMSNVGPEVDRSLGLRLAQLGRFKIAQPRLERAVENDPFDGLALFHLARCLQGNGNPAEAARIYKRVLALESQGQAVAPHDRTLESAEPTPSPAAPAARTLPRRVLALYKKSGGEASDINMIHSNLELVLNHLGLHVDHRNSEDPLPTDAEMERYRGVITWFRTEKMQHAGAYAAWLSRQARAGRKILIFDRLGCTTDADTGRPIEPAAINELHQALGFELGIEWTDEPTSIAIESIDSSMCEFERKLGREAAYLLDVKSLRPTSKVYLKLKRTTGRADTCAAVLTTSTGGFVLDGYSVYYEPEGNGHRWRLNPYKFITEGLGIGTEPRMDPTTRDGLRVVYQHIDGDASNQLVSDKPEVTCADSMLTDVVEKRPYLYSMTFIAKIVDATAGASQRDVEAARRLFAHPRVEAGHHSYTHPFQWRPTSGPRIDAKLEVVRAREVMESLCPPGKPARLAQWSGQANPDRHVLATTYADGQLNINSGGALYDPNHDSQLYLTPFARDVGGLFQGLTSARDDFGITENLTLPAVCFSNVIQTYERTTSPRLLPVNVYGHFYTLATPGARRGIDLIEEWLGRHLLHPMFTSEYLRSIAGFRSAKLAELEPDVYEVSDHASCRTVRFDARPPATAVDFARSRGVIGFNRHAGSLYVHLADSSPARIALASVPAPAVVPHVASSTVDVRDVKLDATGVSLTADTLVPASVQLSGFTPGAPLDVAFDGVHETRTANAEGSVELSRAPSGKPVRIEVRAGGKR